MRGLQPLLLMALVLTPTLALAQASEPSVSLRPPPDAPPPHPVEAGPYAVSVIAEPTLMTHTVYRPTDLSAFTGADRLPIIAWGNGACSNAGLLFSRFLGQIASHGFLVIASGPKDAPLPAFASQLPDQASLTPDPSAGIEAGRTTDEDLIRAIDWAIAENARGGSPYAGRIDPEKVAVMGQSCGGLQATAVAGDPRIKTVVIWNSGVFPDGANRGSGLSGATKASLAAFHTPVAYFLGGPSDIAYANGKDDFERLTTVPAFFGSIRSGHGGTYMHPGGGWFGEVGVAWLQWQLKGDRAAARWFEGADCTLCANPVWEVSKKNMR
jgi:hypothetical protein